MFLTGFVDEVSADPQEQIRATKELGWQFIEARNVGTDMMGNISDQEFEAFAQLLETNGIRVNCYGSAIANGGKSALSEDDFQASKDELMRAIPRMKQLGITMLRGMSFKVANTDPDPTPELEEIIFRKVNELVGICEDHGIIYAHENCSNYGGQSYLHTLKLLDHVKHPNFKLIFDTGNPCFTKRRIGELPYRLQSSREFYENVREFVCYVHIKDAKAKLHENDVSDLTFTYPGEGNGDVLWIVEDLLRRGYDGGFSMEPHMGSGVTGETEEEKTAKRRAIYVEYGRRFEGILADCKKKLAERD